MEPLKVITVTEEQLESLIDKKIDQLHDAVKKAIRDYRSLTRYS